MEIKVEMECLTAVTIIVCYSCLRKPRVKEINDGFLYVPCVTFY